MSLLVKERCVLFHAGPPVCMKHSATLSKSTWCLTSTEIIRLIRDGETVGKGVIAVGEEGDYITYLYTVTTRMTPALRWAAMRAILMFR